MNRLRFITRSLGIGDSGEEGAEAGAAEELGREERGVALRLLALNAPIDCLSMHFSLHPFHRTLHPLQLIFIHEREREEKE